MKIIHKNLSGLLGIIEPKSFINCCYLKALIKIVRMTIFRCISIIITERIEI